MSKVGRNGQLRPLLDQEEHLLPKAGALCRLRALCCNREKALRKNCVEFGPQFYDAPDRFFQLLVNLIAIVSSGAVHHDICVSSRLLKQFLDLHIQVL